MRGRILLTMLLTAMALGACSQKDSLYIEPGKAGAPDSPAKHETPPPARR